MSRPVNCRRINRVPCVVQFKPTGKSSRDVEPVILTLDEFEAIRLTDLEGLYQAQAAEMMNVSRPTLSRIIVSAHSKVAMALVNGIEIRIEGGTVTSDDGPGCRHCVRLAEGDKRCPRCRKQLEEMEDPQ